MLPGEIADSSDRLEQIPYGPGGYVPGSKFRKQKNKTCNDGIR